MERGRYEFCMILFIDNFVGYQQFGLGVVYG